MRRISFTPGEFYHIYNRGTEKRNIFLRKNDYERFLALLFHCNNTANTVLRLEEQLFDESSREDTLVEIGSYCLMPNHFHLLIREKVEGGISRFMQKLSTAYTMYFNRYKQRNGVLFQGKFKATHVNTDRYLKYLIAYIHLNPVKLIDPNWKENGISDRKRAEEYLQRYYFSSFNDYRGIKRAEAGILTPNALPEYFFSVTDFQAYVADWLSLGVRE